MPNNIRLIEQQDYKTVRYIFSALDNNLELSSLLYCDYYIEKEPDVCFVVVDEFNHPCGCIVASKNFYTYQREYNNYLLKLKKVSRSSYIKYIKINKKLDEVNQTYPAHCFISILPSFQKKGYGKELFQKLVEKLKQYNIKGINLVLDKNQSNSISFFERLGFEKYKKITTSKYIYIYNI